jgi:hypothetical protein
MTNNIPQFRRNGKRVGIVIAQEMSSAIVLCAGYQ